MFKLAERKEGQLIYKAVSYYKDANLYMDMAEGYVKSALSKDECIMNYYTSRGRYEGIVEAMAEDLKAMPEDIERMVIRLARH